MAMSKLKESRKEAISSKQQYYFTGKPCKYGHFSKRETRDGSCLECRLSNQRLERSHISMTNKARG
jgi:hypothetical protein